MTEPPSVGDEVTMGIMGGDARILVAEIEDQQPLVDTDGVFIIIDQYGEEHLVEMDGDTWVATSCDALSPDGLTVWGLYLQAKSKADLAKLGYRQRTT